MHSSASASLTFPSPFSFKRRLPASENDKIEHVKQGIMFHQLILFPTQRPSGDTNSYLCSAWPSQSGLGGGKQAGGMQWVVSDPYLPLGMRGHARLMPGWLCPPGGAPKVVTRLQVGFKSHKPASCIGRGKGLRGVQGSPGRAGCVLRGCGISICCPAPRDVCPLQGLGEWGAGSMCRTGSHLLGLSAGTADVGKHLQPGSMCLPKDRQPRAEQAVEG